MRKLLFALISTAFLFACSKESKQVTVGSASAAPEVSTGSTSTTTGGTTTAAATSAAQPSLISFSAGALVAQKPAEYNDSWSAFWMLDENPQSGWATPEHVVTPQTIVVALPEKTELDRLEFDTMNVDGDGRAAKDIDVEMSDSSESTGFQKIASVSLVERADKQSFPVSAKVPGRWLKLTIRNNHGSADYTELMDVRGYGTQLTHTPFQNISGTYETNYGDFHLLQEGTSITGCYEHNNGLLNGGVEGRVMKFSWREGEGGEGNNGPAIMVISSDGKDLFGLWWFANNTSGPGSVWNGTKKSSEVGSCPHWQGKSGGAEAQMKSDLAKQGRTRVYGINFDTDSDVIKPESKTTLDQIVSLLKSDAGLRLKIEGHTDSTGGPEHNQQLSEKRAASVKNYLVGAGIDGTRLTTAGFGSSQPVASNDTELGRAQNRRVELAKQ